MSQLKNHVTVGAEDSISIKAEDENNDLKNPELPDYSRNEIYIQENITSEIENFTIKQEDLNEETIYSTDLSGKNRLCFSINYKYLALLSLQSINEICGFL